MLPLIILIIGADCLNLQIFRCRHFDPWSTMGRHDFVLSGWYLQLQDIGFILSSIHNKPQTLHFNFTGVFKAIGSFALPFSRFNFPSIPTLDKCYLISRCYLGCSWIFSAESEPTNIVTVFSVEQRKAVVMFPSMDPHDLYKCVHRMTVKRFSWHTVSTHFFWVSPHLTRMRRTSSTWFSLVPPEYNTDFNFFHIENQDLGAPSQDNLILSRSPMSSSVKTKKELVKFRPILSGLKIYIFSLKWLQKVAQCS